MSSAFDPQSSYIYDKFSQSITQYPLYVSVRECNVCMYVCYSFTFLAIYIVPLKNLSHVLISTDLKSILEGILKMYHGLSLSNSWDINSQLYRNLMHKISVDSVPYYKLH